MCLVRWHIPWGKITIKHYSDVIMSAMASQLNGVPIVCSNVSSGADQRKHQSSASLAFVRGIHRWPVNSPHKGSVTRKMFPFDDVIMNYAKVEQRDSHLTFEHHTFELTPISPMCPHQPTYLTPIAIPSAGMPKIRVIPNVSIITSIRATAVDVVTRGIVPTVTGVVAAVSK